MTTGHDVLQQLQQQELHVGRAIEQRAAQLAEARGQLQTLQQQERSLIEQIAQARLGAIAAGELVDTLGAADRAAAEGARDRQRAIEESGRTLADTRTQKAALDVLRGAATARAETATEAAETAIAEVLEGLEDTEPHTALQTAWERATADHATAEQRLRESEGGVRATAESISNDRYRTYLAARHYGEPGYRSNPLLRPLDAWLARRSGFNIARAQQVLAQGLVALREQQRRAAEATLELCHDALQQFEQTAIDASHAGPLIVTRDAALEAQASAVAEVEAVEARELQLVQELDHFAAGRDRYTEAAMTALSGAIRQASAAVLERAVAATRSAQDDALVDALHAVRAQQGDAAEAVDRAEAALAAARRAHTRVVALVRGFETDGFARRASRFRHGFALGDLLANMTQPDWDTAAFWRAVAAHHYIEQPPAPRGRPSPWSGGGLGGGGLSGGGRVGGWRSGSGFGGGGGMRSGKGF